MTTTDSTTIAQQIAALFDSDGQTFETADGRQLEDVLQERAIDITHRNRGICGEPVRYDLADGYSIVVAGPAWDFGLPGGCFCWEGVGHSGECQDPTD